MKFPTQHKTCRTTDKADPLRGVEVHRDKNRVWATRPDKAGNSATIVSREMPTVREAKQWMNRPYL